MYSSKLIDVFYALSKTQQRALSKFVQSPYYNKRQDVINLFELLYKTPLENRTALRKEKAFPKIFFKENSKNTEKEIYAPEKMDYVMSFLFKLIEEFLICETLNGDEMDRQIALIEAYRKLGLTKQFQQTLQSAEEMQAESPLRDIHYHEKDFELALENSLFLSAQERDASKNLQEVSSKLDLRFLAQKLKDACRLLAHQAVAKQQYDFGLLEVILPYIQANEYLLKHPSIALYYYYYQSVSNETESEFYFQQYKSAFLASTQAFKGAELQDLYILAINYCVKKANLGKEEYEQELFDFYDAELRLNILMDDGKLSQFKFNNIVKLALRLKKIDWTAQFIENYKNLVDAQYHDTYIHNAYSMLYFAQGKYKETLARLQQVDYKDLLITLDAKVLLIKVYYKLKEFDVLESFITSFKVFLRRKDILAYHSENYKNFINVFQKMINLAPFDKKGRASLREEVQSKKLLEKKWLLECLDAW